MIDHYLNIRKHSEEICAPLQKEDYVVQPIVDVSPPKWHLAHSTWFWEEFVLAKYHPGYKRFHPRYSFLFNSYYNSVGDRVLRLHRGNMSRPTVDEILSYRAHVDEHMVAFLKAQSKAYTELIALGINHEQQHQELLYTDIKYILGHNPLFPAYAEEFKETTSVDADHSFAEMGGGNYSVGFKGDGFSFDNEHGCHQVCLEPFSIRKSLVTNGEYLAFIEAGGYKHPLHWHSDAWTWIVENRIDSPLYWHPVDGEWFRYALAGYEKVKLDEPVTHISFYEAAAFAAWNGARLPTEFEWEASCNTFAWGQRWEHTNSAYLPYPGYFRPAGAIGEYNGKFMVNQMVLRGGSVVTPPGHSRKTYRNFFHPQLRWQFNGIRLCKDKL
ncbi:MAG: ergothioneine biosynthesis protein EgtB [Cyclobacteriaceae bacterium]|jgi:ergothioneine biosynthesis protein EgtB|nr:ergothioneine biosynthesis protein EgtB [Cyclobacteriaceae bacterium]MDH5251313.1 ergothioneine biosynthesis protein EgtB [Cyclobacteriaceae bacterium]